MKKSNYTKEIIDSIKELSTEYKNNSLMFHIGLATQEYSDICTISDKEFSFLLKKYLGELSLGISSQIITDDDYIFDLDEEDF